MTCHTFHAITSPIPEINPLGFRNTTQSHRHDLTQLPRDDEAHSSIKYTRIPKYNVKRYFSHTCATTRLNLYLLSYFEIQSRFPIQNEFRHHSTYLPCDHKVYSSIKSTGIPKYNAKRSFSLICATTRLNFSQLALYSEQPWSYYNLPRVEECRYEELKGDDKNFPWNEIEEELDDTDAKYKPKQQLDYKRVGKGRVDPDDPCTS
ncbi:uncharacterized protein G2W53_026895 [Senna tora]|uniref:Uncharacterized protein n=1 Tax=Senna tora TaxID=362788 RepID=A0A834TIB8_9FABA|nr:uncharacterized protein G2W53_026895 [Senna tora]